ncbi:MAG: hypothetical protein ABJF11_14205 [Reichenbachiella sp.]|uniref:hypothetical protein n=1 Tax=Reichenbachiella sp. TaxID=2184521 RepID=UPI003267D589
MIHIKNAQIEDEEMDNFLKELQELARKYNLSDHVDGVLLDSEDSTTMEVTKIPCSDPCVGGVKKIKIDANGNRYCVCIR